MGGHSCQDLWIDTNDHDLFVLDSINFFSCGVRIVRLNRIETTRTQRARCTGASVRRQTTLAPLLWSDCQWARQDERAEKTHSNCSVDTPAALYRRTHGGSRARS